MSTISLTKRDIESVMHWNKMTDDHLRRFIINERLIIKNNTNSE
jgi:hypothetical protein